jgi:hypothetical protein
MNMGTLTPQLRTAVRREVFAAIQELFADPDAGLELSERAKRRLGLARKSRGGKRFSLAEMKRRYI